MKKTNQALVFLLTFILTSTGTYALSVKANKCAQKKIGGPQVVVITVMDDSFNPVPGATVDVSNSLSGTQTTAEDGTVTIVVDDSQPNSALVTTTDGASAVQTVSPNEINVVVVAEGQ